MSMPKGGICVEIDGEKYLSIGKVAEAVGKSVQTVRLWTDWSDENEAQGLTRYIPSPKRVGVKGTRYFKDSDIAAIKQFGDNIPYGSMSHYNRRVWGIRGKEKVTEV